MNSSTTQQLVSTNGSEVSNALKAPDSQQRISSVRAPRLDHPSKAAIEALPPYERLPIHKIRVVRSEADEDFAIARMAESGIVGFDTETKPAFQAGQASDGPHIVQLATLEHAFIFQVGVVGVSDALRECLESAHLLKVGFGLNSDRGPLYQRYGIKLQQIIGKRPAIPS